MIPGLSFELSRLSHNVERCYNLKTLDDGTYNSVTALPERPLISDVGLFRSRGFIAWPDNRPAGPVMYWTIIDQYLIKNWAVHYKLARSSGTSESRIIALNDVRHLLRYKSMGQAGSHSIIRKILFSSNFPSNDDMRLPVYQHVALPSFLVPLSPAQFRIHTH